MAAIDHEGQCRHHTDAVDPNPPGHGFVHVGNQLALAEIGYRGVAVGRRHPVGDAYARATGIETEHQPRARLGATVHPGPHAQRAMIAMDARKPRLPMGKAGIPHQGAVGKYPHIAHRQSRKRVLDRCR